MMITPIMFKIRPVFAISIIFILLVPKIIAFGGVATGSIKAKEADRVAGNIKNKGLISVVIEMPAKTGKIISVVAVFEVSSVKKVIIKAIIAIINIGCNDTIQLSSLPNHNDNSDSLNPVASAKPPPNKRTIFHGSLEAVSQFIILLQLLFFGGKRNDPPIPC